MHWQDCEYQTGAPQICNPDEIVQIKSVAKLTGVEIALPEAYVHHTDNHKPEFLSKFPLGKIPAFESTDGFKLVEGIPVARYSTLAPDHLDRCSGS